MHLLRAEARQMPVGFSKLAPTSVYSGHQTRILWSVYEPWALLTLAHYLSLLINALKLLQYLAATMFSHIINWLGTRLVRPMIHDTLSLRWILPISLTIMASVSTCIGILSLLVLCFGSHSRLGLPEPEDSRLEAHALFMAERLQHVEAPTGERCVICHDPEPNGPVRLSCQNLFLLRLHACHFCPTQELPTLSPAAISAKSVYTDVRSQK